MIDSLSIVAGSEIIFDKNGIMIPYSMYIIDYPRALLLSSGSLIRKHSEIIIKYRVFPVDFSEPLYTRDMNETVVVGPVLQKANTLSNDSYENFFTYNQVNKRGSISRGITVGKKQDEVINSNLNLQVHR